MGDERKRYLINTPRLDDPDTRVATPEEIDKYFERPRLVNFSYEHDFVIENQQDYYDMLSRMVLVSRAFDDEEIEELARLVRTKFVGKRGRKRNKDDESFVLFQFVADQAITGIKTHSRVEAIKIIMEKRRLTIDGATYLYDKVMKDNGLLGSRRGRKKGNNKK